ncbi:response regulator transcription factor [Flavobacterium sp.]|jgi:DNA-binding NarL/FixJ family response regulator|uniref:response regulator transcription factor n=1 Tax=Flavobacterium sp. TaxID=239 RepID=UPI002A817734|nr:response regulator transcription factor [Flavobacterium sp.]
MSELIKIVLADDEELFRKGLVFLLQREANIKVQYEASNGQELVDYLKTCEVYPDIILMDLKMPFLNGVEATKLIHSEYPNINIIALTSYNTESFIANMINVGASSYLVKNATPQEMLNTIKEVANKGFYYNETVMKVIHKNIISATKNTKSILDDDFLTAREKEVLELICKQFSTPEIAEKLFISPRTVEGHRNNLLLKTQSRNVAGLVVYAIQNKIMTIEDDSM